MTFTRELQTQVLKQDGYITIQDISTMSRDTIMTLHYSTTTDASTVATELNGGQSGKLTSLQDFLTSRAVTQDSALLYKDYLALTRDQYDNFRTDPAYMHTAQGGAPRAPPGPHPSSSRDPVSDFK
jgi:hypothetical protein